MAPAASSSSVTPAAVLILFTSYACAFVAPAARKSAFISPCTSSGLFRSKDIVDGGKSCWHHRIGLGPQRNNQNVNSRGRRVIRSMYLPPGGPNRKNGLGPILQSVLTFFLVVGFFVSPLGGLLFAMIQFSVALSILVPLALVAAFQVWQYFNTISGPCPKCGAPLRVFKDQASICLNCGSIVEADASQSKINLVDDVVLSADDEWQRSSGGISDFGWMDGYFGARPTPSSEAKSKASSVRRQQTIIDVQVKDDDE